ncbi:MAG: tellurium resistance protein TerZ [Solirubrobacteraceae bacterium]|nr:tellurium resistance protein TerZ [Solirubrobacteraceae bacterium]
MTINLSKGQRIDLAKSDGGALTRVKMGLGWDAIERKGRFGRSKTADVDLDASCVLLDAESNIVDAVWFRQLNSKDGSITHTGDNLTGAGDGDDESILVDLSRVPALVKTLSFTVTCYSRQGFSEIQNAFCRVVDETTKQEIARYDLSAQGPHTAMVIANVYRHAGGWKMAALGETGEGKTYLDVVPLITASV